MSTFEDQLWSQLVRDRGEQMAAAAGAAAALASSVSVTTPTPRRRLDVRRPALVTGTAVSIAGIATAGVFALSAAPAAFAVTKNSDGTVTITLNDLASLPALNQRLSQDGIPVTAVPMNATCPASGSISVMPSSRPAGPQPAKSAIAIDATQIPTGEVGVLGATETSSGRVELVAGAVTPPAPPCLNSTAFATAVHRTGSSNVAPAVKTRPAATRARHVDTRHLPR
jgi:hypothetical protein